MLQKYVPPIIESEGMVEQTSLACNVTALPDRSPACARDNRKSDAYFNETILVCDTILEQDECMVALS